MNGRSVADWLESLRRGGVATIDTDAVLDVERLLTAWTANGGKVAVEDAADAIAARIAGSAEQYRVVRDGFVKWFGHDEAASGDPDPPSKKPPGRPKWSGHLKIGLLVGGGAAVVVGALVPPTSCEPPDQVDVHGESTDAGNTGPEASTGDRNQTSEPTDDTRVIMVQPPREVEAPHTWSSTLVFVWPGIVTAILVVLGLRMLGARRLAAGRRTGQIQEGLRRKKAAQLRDGPSDGEPYAFKVTAPLEPTAIDAAADVLARPGLHEPGTRLDVPRSLDRTVRAGGRLVARFLRSSQPAPLLVLVDVEAWGRTGSAHPLAHAAEWILQRWQRTGLRFVRFDYVDRPVELRAPGSSHPVSIQQLARRYGAARLLVWSRLRRPGNARERREWLAALRPWGRRVLIDLDPRPMVHAQLGNDGRDEVELQLAKEVEDTGLTRYPFTSQGLVLGARHLAISTGRPGVAKDTPPDPARLERALAQWGAAASCVPDPTWMHLDALRVLLPEVRSVITEARGVWWLLRWLDKRGCLVGRPSDALYRLALTDDAEVRLLGDPSEIEVDGGPTDLELWIRGQLDQQLDDARPRTENERWWTQAKHAFHRCKRDLLGSVTQLRDILGTPADALARQLLARLQHRIDAGHLHGAGANDLVAQTLGVALAQRVELPVELRRRPRAWELAAGAGVLGVVVVATIAFERGLRVEPAHYEVLLPGDDVPRSYPALPKRQTVPLELPAGARKMQLVRVDAGDFWMGSEETEDGRYEDERRHRVTLTSPFMICDTEVTQAQWRAVMGDNPSNCTFGCGDDVAVHDASWETAVEYLNRLSQLERLEPCYTKTGEDWAWDRSCEGFRLPTEAEWEYAARAGSADAYSFGDDPAQLDAHAWYAQNSGNQAHPVATKNANAWGLYDVHGNVWELTWDWYEENLGAMATSDPTGPPTGEHRVLRGGSFGDEANGLRSASRIRDFPDVDFRDVGLRCVRGPHPSQQDAP